MNKTQPGRRNHIRWKVFTQIMHRNVTHNDELEAPEPGFFIAFSFTIKQEDFVLNIQWEEGFLKKRRKRQ